MTAPGKTLLSMNDKSSHDTRKQLAKEAGMSTGNVLSAKDKIYMWGGDVKAYGGVPLDFLMGRGVSGKRMLFLGRFWFCCR